MPDLSIITNRKYRKRLRNLVEKLSSVKDSLKEDLLELPEDRKYTMRPERQEAYSNLMGQYATFEAQDAVDDIRNSDGMTAEEREELGAKGRKHLLKNYNPETLIKKWDEVLTKLNKESGSWETRNHPRWTLEEIAA